MIRRNAPIAKIITAALCILAVVYLLYIFNETSGKLKDTERVAHRYRREQEALSSQLSGKSTWMQKYLCQMHF